MSVSAESLSPEKLGARPGLSEKGFTGRKYSLRFGMYDSRKFARNLISGLAALKRFIRRIPSAAPVGWFETIIKGPS